MNDDAPTRVPPAGSASVQEPGRRAIPGERYAIRGVQGRGGQSMVYLAYDQFLGREVALKQLLPDAAVDPTIATAGSPAAARFLREARVAGQLEHPNIVPIYELGRSADGSWYCTQRLIRGRTLLQALRDSSGLVDRLSLLPHFIAVCHAVAYAHSRGVIHRDIKPANVMVGQFGETVLLDWGLAKLLGQPDGGETGGAIQVSGDDSDAHTQLGHAVGTPAYMSPEQALGQVDAMDERTDIWSLGVLLYVMLTGGTPFQGATPAETVAKVASERVLPVRQRCPEAPAELAAVAERALAREPERRYRSAEELAREVEAYQAGRRVAAHEYSSWELLRRFVSRNRGITLVSAAALVLLASSLVLLQRKYHEARLNLAEAFLDKGRIAERDLQWASAEAFFAAARVHADRVEARWGARLDANRGPRPLRRLLGHTEQVDALALSNDARLLASACADGTARVWDVESGREIARLEGHAGRVMQLAFAADGALASAGADGTIRLWHGPSGHPVARLEDDGQPVDSLAFSRDGAWLASGSRDGVIRVWDTCAARPIASFMGPAESVARLALSSDGRWLALANPVQRLWLLDLAGEGPARPLDGHQREVSDVAFSPDARLLATASADKTVLLWEVPSGRAVARLAGHEGSVAMLAFSGDGRTLASAATDGTIRLWDVATRRATASVAAHRGGALALAFSADGRILASGGFDHAIRLWDPSPREALLLGHAGEVNSLAFAAEGALLVSGGEDGTVRLWRTREAREIARQPAHRYGVKRVLVSPDGRRAASAGGEGAIALWELPSGRAAGRLQADPGGVEALAFSPDGRRIVSGDDAALLRVWDAVTGRELAVLAGHRSQVTALAISPDGKRAISGSRDRTIRTWDLATGRETLPPSRQRGAVLALAFAPDGRSFASGGDDRWIRRWSAEDGTLLATLVGHLHWVQSLAFSPDGATLLSGGFDTVRLWDPAAATQVAVVYPGELPTLAVAFSPDAKLLATGAVDGTIRLLPLGELPPPEEHLQRVLRERGLRLVGTTLLDPEEGPAAGGG